MVRRNLAILVFGFALITTACSMNINRKVDPSRVDSKDNGSPPQCVEIVTYAQSDFTTQDIRRDKYCLQEK